MWGSCPLLPPLMTGCIVTPLALGPDQNVLGGRGSCVRDLSSVMSACPKDQKGPMGASS